MVGCPRLSFCNKLSTTEYKSGKARGFEGSSQLSSALLPVRNKDRCFSSLYPPSCLKYVVPNSKNLKSFCLLLMLWDKTSKPVKSRVCLITRRSSLRLLRISTFSEKSRCCAFSVYTGLVRELVIISLKPFAANNSDTRY